MLNNFSLLKTYFSAPKFMIRKIKLYLTKGHQRSVKAKKNILFSIVIKGMSILIQMILVPLYLAYLDKEQYGIWLTLSSIIAWFHFFDIGLGNGLRNKLSEALANENFELGKIYVSTSYFFHIVIFGFLIVIFLIINQFLNWGIILNTTSISADSLSKVASYVFVLFMIRFILMQIGVISFAFQISSLNSLFSTSANVLSLIAVFILSKTTEGNLLYLGLAISWSPILVFLTSSGILFYGSFKKIRPSFRHIDLKSGIDILGLGYKFLIVQLGAIIIYSTSNIIISQYFSPSEVTPFNIAYKYFQLPVMIYAIIMTPIWSAVTDAYVKNDFSWLRKTLSKLNRLSFLTIGVIFLMLVVSQPTYKLWVGSKVLIPRELSLVMSVWASMMVLISPYSSFINGIGKLNLSIRLFWILIPVFFLLAFELVKTPLTYSGVMVATIIVNMISASFTFVQVRKILNGKASGIWSK